MWSALRACPDGQRCRVLRIDSTNRVDLIDSAMRRSGRTDGGRRQLYLRRWDHHLVEPLDRSDLLHPQPFLPPLWIGDGHDRHEREQSLYGLFRRTRYGLLLLGCRRELLRIEP